MSHVFVDTGAFFAALAFLDARDAGEFDVVYPEEIDRDRAEAILRSHRDKAYSYCDATSFAVMERLRIREALTFDRHFAQFGVVTLAM